ncbi:hypothetical protein U1Q18_034520 [Sarracenia purpurea var. burkii]
MTPRSSQFSQFLDKFLPTYMAPQVERYHSTKHISSHGTPSGDTPPIISPHTEALLPLGRGIPHMLRAIPKNFSVVEF